jgi:hypothetical protein
MWRAARVRRAMIHIKPLVEALGLTVRGTIAEVGVNSPRCCRVDDFIKDGRGVIMLRVVVVCMFVVASLIAQQSTPFSDVARGQGRKEVLRQAGTAAIEKEITLLERRILLLQKELRDLRTKLQQHSMVTLIPVKHIKPSDVVEIIDAVYKETPEVLVVEALPKLMLVAVRADAATTKEVTLLVRKVEEAAMGPWLDGGGVGFLRFDQRVRLIREATERRKGTKHD